MSLKPTTRLLMVLVCIMLFASAVLAGCSKDAVNQQPQSGGTENKGEETQSGGSSDEPVQEEPFKLSIMTIFYPSDKAPEPAPEDSPVIQKLEEYTNTDLEILWTPSTNYEDKFNVTLASNDMPMVILAPGKTATVISACRNGVFWELGPYFEEYPNLSQFNPIVLNNISIDGKVYGLYRARDLGRNGIIYRHDWLQKVGMNELKTIDDFYTMLKKFTYEDPDGDGKDDTFGMVVHQSNYQFNVSALWFGAPNGWGENENGELVPAHLTPEYFEALKWWKKLYDEKLINEDFAALDPEKRYDFIVTEQAGAEIQVCDDAGRLESRFKDAGKSVGTPNTAEDVDVRLGIVGAVEGPKGLRALPTSGYNLFYLVSKQSVKTEDELKRVLKFFDQLGDREMQDLLDRGIEGIHYELVDGKVKPIEGDQRLGAQLSGLNQLLLFVPRNNQTPRVDTEVRELQTKVIAENEKIVVGNPAEPFISEVYSQKGPQLDQIIEDARVQFIVGQIDEQGWKDAIEQWRKLGGDDYIKEINDLYKKANTNQ